MLGAPALASLQAEEPSRVMRLEAADFQELIVRCKRLNAEVMRAMADRVGRVQKLVIDAPMPVVSVVGRATDAACHDIRDFLFRNHVPFTWINVDDPAPPLRGGRELPSFDAGPVVMLEDGTQLTAPSYRELAERLDLHTAPTKSEYDVVIVGGGVSGLAAAVYGASEGLCTLLVERVAPGGQAGTSSRIENYLGFPSGLSGEELSTLAVRQAERLGAEIVVSRSVTSLEPANGTPHHVVVLDGDVRISAGAVVVAGGVAWRHLALPGFDGLVSRGIFYGAARTETASTRGQDVYLVGGGNSAGQAALLLSGYARTVTMVVRGRMLEESMSQYLVEQLRAKPNIEYVHETEVVEARGTDHLEEIVLQSLQDGKRDVRGTRALFVFIGADADTDWLPDAVIRDERGYVCTGRDILELEGSEVEKWSRARDPYLLETSVPGVFAAGDVRHGSVKRCASAVGEGSMAIAFVHQYLAEAPMAAVGRESLVGRV